MTGKTTATQESDTTAPQRRTRIFVAVAVLASLLGVGVVFLGTPVEQTKAQRTARDTAIVRNLAPRTAEITFNPRASRGLKVAKTGFRFTYRHQASRRDEVRTRIEDGWNNMLAAALRVLMRRTPHELKSDTGLDDLAADLGKAIDQTLFHDGIAEVEQVLIQQMIVQ
ncbi:MAG: flagellar basal body-associated protein FliL [Planctomycetota bacterium]